MTNNRRSSLKFDELAMREQELAESSDYVDTDNPGKDECVAKTPSINT